MARGAWWATFHGVAKSRTRLSTQHRLWGEATSGVHPGEGKRPAGLKGMKMGKAPTLTHPGVLQIWAQWHLSGPWLGQALHLPSLP